MRRSAYKLILFIVCVVLLVGCQATPDKPVVVQKDMEQMIEKASSETTVDESTEQSGITAQSNILLRDKVKAPDALKLEIQKGNFTLAVNAPVIVPNAYKMPIIQVKAGDFTQEQVTVFWDALVGDTVMWQRQTEYTKSEIEERLLVLRKRLSQEEICEEVDGETKDEIDYLEKAYETAPEDIEMSIVDSTLKKSEISLDGIFITGTSGGNKDKTMGFFVQNVQGGNAVGFGSTMMRFSTKETSYNYGQVNTLAVSEDTVLDESIKQYMKTTPTEAKAIVESFLKQTNTPMMVHSIKLVNDEETGLYDDVVAPAAHYAYNIGCVRTIDDVLPTAYIRGSTYVEEDDDPEYIKTWEYESLGFMVTDNGIIEIDWRAPIELLETKVQDCTLLPFTEIQEVLEKMIPIKFEATVKGTDNLTCRIEEVRLEMMRVVEQGSTENGLLIPVWNFYGVRERTYNGNTDMTGKYIMLCVNAVDGSVIDKSKGY